MRWRGGRRGVRARAICENMGEISYVVRRTSSKGKRET